MKKRLKIFIPIAIAAISFLSVLFPVREARAETSGAYMRVITQDTPFYADSSGTQLLFYLPYTYYVKILKKESGFSRIEINGTGATAALDGYAPTDLLFSDGLEVKNPFVELEVTTASTAVLYADSSLSVALQYIFPSREMRYYGFLPTSEGSRIYYVSYNNRLGYVKESEIKPFVIPDHPNELTFIVKEPDPVPETPSVGKDDEPNADDATVNLRIVIIACLAFAGVIALFVAFKTKPPRKKHNYYDENDYE